MRACARDGGEMLRANRASGDRRVVSCAGEGRRLVAGSALRRRARIGVISTLVAFAVWLVTAASASAFTAQGSVEQVDVTGLAPNAQVSLLKKSATVDTQNADSLGGLLFRNVKPGAGYRVSVTSTGETSGPITVHSDAAAPWDPSIYNQSIPDNGYTYLTTRDGTQLSIDVHPPTSPAGEPGVPSRFHFPTFPQPGVPTPSYTPPYPTLIEYSGYGYANPAGPENGIAVLANLMGFAVVDVNMRGTGCSGGAFDFFEKDAESRRLRRDRDDRPPAVGARQQGRHARHLLRRDQPAVHGAAAAARPRGDRAAVGDRRDGDDALPRWHPQRRLRGGLGRTAPAERRTGRSRQRPGMGKQADRRRRSDLRGQPGPARRGGEPDGKRSKRTRRTTRRWPTRSTRSRSSTRSTCRRSWPASGRTSRPGAIVPIWLSTSPVRVASGSRSPTAPTSTRSIRTRTTGCTTSWSCTSRTRHRSSTRRSVRAAAPVVYQEAMGLPKGDVVTLPPDPIQLQPTYESALSAFEALPAIRVLFDNGAGTSPTGSTTAGDPYPGFEQSFSKFPIPGTKAQSWYFGPGGTLNATAANRRRGRLLHLGCERRAADGLRGQHRHGRSLGQRVRVGMELGAAPGRLRRVLRVGAAHDRHHRRRWGRRPPVGQVIHSGRRSPGDRQRGASRRQRDVRPERLDPGERAQARHQLEQTSSSRGPRCSSRSRPCSRPMCSPCPRTSSSRSSSRCTSRGMPTARARASGSRSAAPNGTQPIWSFGHTQPAGTTATESIAFSPSMPSSLILPIVPGVSVPTGLPACPSLRNEPCRPYQAFVNNGS